MHTKLPYPSFGRYTKYYKAGLTEVLCENMFFEKKKNCK